MTTHKIVSRWDSSRVLFECELPADLPSGMAMRHAMERAVSEGRSLSDADLRDADLRGADLRDADLRGADLRDADLRDADLRDAVLSGAVLRDADLRGADLRDADLSGAVLRGAVLRDADLRGAVLRGAVLRGAVLRDADLRDQKNDFWEILLRAPREIAGLRLALVEGRVDGSTYEGACACLVGTIGNVRGVPYSEVGNGIKPDSSRPAERWFMGIRRGDTPQTSQISAITVEWLDEFTGLLAMAQAPAVGTAQA